MSCSLWFQCLVDSFMVLTFNKSIQQSIQSFFKLFHQSIILANTQWGQISRSGLTSVVYIFMPFSFTHRFIICAFYVHLQSVLRENYENNACKTSPANTNIHLIVMIKTVFSLFPPGLSWGEMSARSYDLGGLGSDTFTRNG